MIDLFLLIGSLLRYNKVYVTCIYDYGYIAFIILSFHVDVEGLKGANAMAIMIMTKNQAGQQQSIYYYSSDTYI